MPRRRGPDVPIEALMGGKIAPERDAVRGMRALETKLAGEFKSHVKSRNRLAKAGQPLRQALAGQVSDEARAAAKSLSAIHAQRTKRRIPAPAVRRDQRRIYTGSIGATHVPPFDYQWTWSAQNGGARNFPVANRLTGELDVDCDTAMNNASSAWCRAALGIYFRPVVTNGILRVSANPGFTFD